MFGPDSRVGAIAFIQSVAIVTLYSGFVQEYESSATCKVASAQIFLLDSLF